MIVVNIGEDAAFFRFTVSRHHLLGLTATACFHKLYSFIPTVCLSECILTIKGRCACLFSQLFYVSSNVVHSVFLLSYDTQDIGKTTNASVHCFWSLSA